MSDRFFEKPILNSPYSYPASHWELDKETRQPTQLVVEKRRPAEFITPIPTPKKQKGKAKQESLDLDSGTGLSTAQQQYEKTASVINELRFYVDQWRELKDPAMWKVSASTERLLEHWRSHAFQSIRPFFCQIEAVEVAIWLFEVAPTMGTTGKKFLDHLKLANQDANPELFRVALKLATGAGKTTVMAMLIAWQTVNFARHPGSKRYTRGFLIVAPGLTIKDRLQVLMPNDPGSYYDSRELVPRDMLPDLGKAKIVITNYHAFKLRERLEISKGGRALLEGRGGEKLSTLETEGQMLQRVMPELMGMKNVMAINDEAHHCYREKPPTDDDLALKGDEKEEAKQNAEAARLWITGLETVKRQIGITQVMDLSATPFFLRGSGYIEGTLFPWTMSDFSLMDAIECGIVKLPRVPVSDNVMADVPMFRNLWENIRHDMPKKGRGKGDSYDPHKLPLPLKTALEALYGHYKKTFELWQEAGVRVPPCFIVVCNNTSTSKLVYDYVSGFDRISKDGDATPVPGRLELFRNSDEHGTAYGRPRTLLIDSEQLESGEELDDNFKAVAAKELELFKREYLQRTGNQQEADKLTDSQILREVMNTVGKEGKLGEQIRCVVSVSMLTEGWDANTVTHVLGVRAFGTQLLCEQVIGRALRRQSYDLNDEQMFNVEYADVLGIPFDFAAKPVVAPPQPPRETILVRAVRPERDALEIRFPRVAGYRVELPKDKVKAAFNNESRLVLDPRLVGATQTRNEGIIGEGANLSLLHTRETRTSTILFGLTSQLMDTKWRVEGEPLSPSLFTQLKPIVKEWMDGYLDCQGDTYPAQLLHPEIGDLACERITAAISRQYEGDKAVMVVLDAYNPEGSTKHVKFTTSKTLRWTTSSQRCHVNYAILDSEWEGELCRVIEEHPRVRAYVKNQNLGLEVPYRWMGETRHYLPDFIVLVDDGHDEEDLLHLIVEVKGYRGEDAKEKKSTMDTYWIPGVNNLKTHGRWAFAEFTKPFAMEWELTAKIAETFGKLVAGVVS